MVSEDRHKSGYALRYLQAFNPARTFLRACHPRPRLVTNPWLDGPAAAAAPSPSIALGAQLVCTGHEGHVKLQTVGLGSMRECDATRHRVPILTLWLPV
mmetsp:Transcript_38189/g.110293  ORF Transcript_38189/g.110293 Transcript_38189/m.110293 type:complete len:99 (+) Transcript_38189:609-905(+)